MYSRLSVIRKHLEHIQCVISWFDQSTFVTAELLSEMLFDCEAAIVSVHVFVHVCLCASGVADGALLD